MAEMRTTTLRLRSVRFKSGGSIRVLRPPKSDMRDALAKSTDKLLNDELGAQMVGYALVAWGADGSVFSVWDNSFGSGVAAAGVPQYVKDVLLADVASKWSRDD